MKKTTAKNDGKRKLQPPVAILGGDAKKLQPMAGEKLAPVVREILSPLARELTNVDHGRLLSEIKERITIKATDFANEITNFNIQQNELKTEVKITDEHIRNNREVRQLLVDRGIVPEALPPAEDVKKVERRLKTERKKLPKQVEPFDKQETDIE